MKNTEEPITGSIYQGVAVRHGQNPYEGHKEVLELTLKGFSCNQIIVIDIETAQELKKQLEFLL
jgi:hypothetical protein